MKKLFVLAIVALVAVGSVFAQVTNAGNASGGDSLLLTANVGYRLYADLDGNITFDVNAFGAEAASQDSKANLNIVSNRKTWTVQFESTNSGTLVSTDTTLAPIPYKVSLSTTNTSWVGVAKAAGLANFTSLATVQELRATGGDARTSTAGVNYTLAVAVDAPETGLLWEQGVYTDTITVSVVAN